MLTGATHASTCQSPLCYSRGTCGQLRWKKTDHYDVQGNSAGGGMTLAPRRVTVQRRWSFFSCPLFLSPGLGFRARP
jgi:hypothetical protein